MNYKLSNGKTIRIPDDELKRSMGILGLTEEEAIKMYLEDEGYEVNEEQEALNRKAKENRITATIHQARAEPKFTPKTQKERVHKDDPTKEGIIKAIAEMLPDLNATDVKIENVGKLITFKLGADTFKLDLIRQRPPKANK